MGCADVTLLFAFGAHEGLLQVWALGCSRRSSTTPLLALRGVLPMSHHATCTALEGPLLTASAATATATAPLHSLLSQAVPESCPWIRALHIQPEQLRPGYMAFAENKVPDGSLLRQCLIQDSDTLLR